MLIPLSLIAAFNFKSAVTDSCRMSDLISLDAFNAHLAVLAFYKADVSGIDGYENIIESVGYLVGFPYRGAKYPLWIPARRRKRAYSDSAAKDYKYYRNYK